jgi:protein-S-isoprenylcysteine O-methyltransferase Ste14
MERAIAILAAVCLTIYWGYVLIKLIRLGRKLGKDPNALPRERVGQLMRLVWYPCILVLLAGLWIAGSVKAWEKWTGWQSVFKPLWGIDEMGVWGWVAVAVASALCVTCTAFTFVCWRKMGRSWRIGIDPNEKLALVSTGPYQYVRHPIYALRMVINVCAFLMVPTVVVAVTAGVDFILLQIEARREERYMESKHGQEYARYKGAVGRFFPRMKRAAL